MEKINFFYVLITILLFLNSSCDRLKTEAQYPGVSLYKTRGDYFDKVSVGIKKDENRIYCTPDAHEKLIITGADTILRYRTKLINGYILDAETGLEKSAFLSMSYKELLLWQEKYNKLTMPVDTAWKYLLDKEPFTEFYRAKDNDMFHFEGVLDTTGLDNIIRKGRIEEYFTKLK